MLVDSPIVVSALPSLVRVVAIHVFHDLERVRPKILLVDDPVRADDKRLDPSRTILRRCRNQRESSDHYALNHIVQPAQRRGRTLSLEDFEEVAVVWLLSPRTRIALLDCICKGLADRPSPGSICVLPGQPVLLPRCADNLLRILLQPGVVMNLSGVLQLRLDV